MSMNDTPPPTSGIKNMLSKALEKIPGNLGPIKAQIQEIVQSVLEDLLKKLKVVTREEFEVQSQVLAKTREKIEALEKTLADLEKHLKKE